MEETDHSKSFDSRRPQMGHKLNCLQWESLTFFGA